MPKKIIFQIAVIFFAALILRLYFIISYHYISPDGTQYAMIGYNLFHHGEYQSNGSQFPDIIQPPLYPFATGLFTLIFSPELAGKMISLIFGILLIFAVYRFALFLRSDQSLALFSAAIIAMHPALISVSSQAVTESLYLFLLFSGFSCGWLFIKTGEMKFALLTSVAYLFAFLTRPEGMVFFAVYFFILLIRLVQQKIAWRSVLLFLIPFVLGASLYIGLISQYIGYVTLSPKFTYMRGQARLKNYLQTLDRQAGRTSNPIELEERYKFSLTPDSTGFAADALFKRDLIMRNLSAAKAGSEKNGKQRFKNALTVIGANLTQIVGRVIRGFWLPFPIAALILIGLFRLDLKKHRGLLIYGIIMSLAVFSFVLSHVEDRFLYPLTLFLAIPAGRGLRQVFRWSRQLFSKTSLFHLKQKSAIYIALIVFFLLHLSYYSVIASRYKMKEYYHQSGLILAKFIPHNERVSATSPLTPFFAGLNYCTLPFASLEGVVKYLQKNKTKYILLEMEDRVNRPLLLGLLTPRHPENRLIQAQNEFSAMGQHFYLYKLKD